MTIIEQIMTALLLSSPDDLRVIRRYIRWMKFRHTVNDRFYFPAHWITSPQKYHWVGR